jgi:hypothetical protein
LAFLEVIFAANVNFLIWKQNLQNLILKLLFWKKEHQTESDKFYKIQNEIKSLVKIDNSVCAISMDFEKNLHLFLTKVSCQYYLRQLWISQLLYSWFENWSRRYVLIFWNFAGKGPNESIYCVDFYIKNRKSNFRKFFIFSDNCFAKNKDIFRFIIGN